MKYKIERILMFIGISAFMWTMILIVFPICPFVIKILLIVTILCLMGSMGLDFSEILKRK